MRRKMYRLRMSSPERRVKRVFLFPTIRRVLEKNGLHEGENFTVIDGKEIFGKNPVFGILRKLMIGTI